MPARSTTLGAAFQLIQTCSAAVIIQLIQVRRRESSRNAFSRPHLWAALAVEIVKQDPIPPRLLHVDQQIQTAHAHSTIKIIHILFGHLLQLIRSAG